jgi:uncharacterized protein (TIGR03435 family)
MTMLRVIASVLISVAAWLAQAAPTNLPDFIYGLTGGPGTNNPGQISCRNTPLRSLLLRAYDLKTYQLSGPPAIDRDRYDIVAKIPPGSTKGQVDLMLQSLLVERFGLAVHRETRELPIYELVVAKGGSKLKAPEKPAAGQTGPAQPERPADGRPPRVKMTHDRDGNPELPPGAPNMIFFNLNGVAHVSARMQTVAALLQHLEGETGRGVVDKTGLTGTYDFNLFYAPDPSRMVSIGPPPVPEPPSLADAGSDPAPTLLEAFERQLGLRLEPSKGPVEVLVVDRVNRAPTEN